LRRKDREMSKKFGIEIIDKSRYGVLSVIDEENNPYNIPLSIVRDGNTLYFHSAQEGRKVKIFKNNPLVNIVFVEDVQVPDNYSTEELDEIVKDESRTVLLISSVFTTEFASTMVRGKVNLVENKKKKIKALRLICKKYTPDKMDYFPTAIKAGLERVNVYSIEIDNITAKRKKYDDSGKEMKWERME